MNPRAFGSKSEVQYLDCLFVSFEGNPACLLFIWFHPCNKKPAAVSWKTLLDLELQANLWIPALSQELCDSQHYLSPLCLSFLICEMGNSNRTTSLDCWERIKWGELFEGLMRCLELSEPSPNVAYFFCCCSCTYFWTLIAASMELKHIMYAPNTHHKNGSFYYSLCKERQSYKHWLYSLRPYNLVEKTGKVLLKKYN